VKDTVSGDCQKAGHLLKNFFLKEHLFENCWFQVFDNFQAIGKEPAVQIRFFNWFFDCCENHRFRSKWVLFIFGGLPVRVL
jgi:hypothetical protein